MAAPLMIAHLHRVRGLNDAFRRSFTGGQVTLTAGVAALPEAAQAKILAAVRGFERFNADNDPHGEHDFGEVQVG